MYQNTQVGTKDRYEPYTGNNNTQVKQVIPKYTGTVIIKHR